jgi:phosphoribosylcarboxyaminoimidazole (NCAIR) mutase
MEGALPSVLGGLVKAPIIAVPTSTGYGANFAGLAPLLAMLNSCAPGVGVVNIDNGFGAAVLAKKILALTNTHMNKPVLFESRTTSRWAASSGGCARCCRCSWTRTTCMS